MPSTTCGLRLSSPSLLPGAVPPGQLRPCRRSGSTPHDDVQPTCSTQCRRCTMLVLDRQCERLLRCGRSTLIRHSNVPSDRQLRASNGSDALSRHRSSMQRAQPITPHHHRLRGQIAIERAAPSVPHLPRLRALQVCRRRPLVCVAASVMAGIRKPLQTQTCNAVAQTKWAALTLDRIVGLSLLIDGNVGAVRDGEALTAGDQHQRHAIPAGRSHHSIRPSIAAH